MAVVKVSSVFSCRPVFEIVHALKDEASFVSANYNPAL